MHLRGLRLWKPYHHVPGAQPPGHRHSTSKNNDVSTTSYLWNTMEISGRPGNRIIVGSQPYMVTGVAKNGTLEIVLNFQIQSRPPMESWSVMLDLLNSDHDPVEERSMSNSIGIHSPNIYSQSEYIFTVRVFTVLIYIHSLSIYSQSEFSQSEYIFTV